MSLDDRLRGRLTELADRGLQRRAPAITERDGIRYRIDGRAVVGLCSNDYLGFADESRLRHADANAPTGAGGSRLICGDLPAHRAIERSLAELVGAADAVLFPSGFQLNVGVLPALIDATDTVHSDALNHASLIDGLRLSRARVQILDHLTAPPVATVANPSVDWWITESIFSMDGDRLDERALASHHARGGASYVDEAHAFGLFDGGRGLLASRGIASTALVCTLSKALGSAGAFVAASATACEWIRTRARSYVFSTGTSPALVARIAAALDLARGPIGDERRARLWDAAAHLADRLALPASAPPSPIVPILVGGNATAVALSHALLERGWHVQAIRPPTVPDGTARLRITVSAGHDRETLDAFVDDLFALCDRHRVTPTVERGRTTALVPGVVP
jgi:7-keto-8-aminopelargonate synthetase-like enzyme